MFTGSQPDFTPTPPRSAPSPLSAGRLRIRRVELSRPFAWLRRGWGDLQRTPTASLAYGALFAAIGFAVLLLGDQHPRTAMAALSGFLLVGPLLAVGFYELSRRSAADEPVDAVMALTGLRRCWRPLAAYGVLLALFYFCWERLTVAILAFLLGSADLWDFVGLLREIFLSPHHPILAMAWILSGGVIAALCFLVSVITAPVLVDRGGRLADAVEASITAVSENVFPMLLWSGLIVALVLIGFATIMVGLVVIVPLLGHATWHAYRDLVE
ncbi:integral membrane protein [Oryzomicrobium terrae]|uniref:Integral membrane protein n=1 Tax=Oryzomicrobium terrae TaxID=1735038 RepID=A0A5C1EB31_9RHOO|nr:integral membrane protein [Oryzomicrobium terrae]